MTKSKAGPFFLLNVISLLSINPKLKNLSGNILWIIVNRIFRLGIGLVVLGAIGRYLGPAEFGELNYSLSVTWLFTIVATLGFDGIVIRELVKQPERESVIVGTAVYLRSAGALLAIALISITSVCISGFTRSAFISITVALAFFPASFEVIELWFQKNLQVKHTVLARSVATMLGAGLRLALVWGGAPLLAFGWAFVAEAALSAFALIYIYQQKGELLKSWRWETDIARILLKGGWPLVMSGLIVSLYFRLDQLLVQRVVGNAGLGIYSASVRIMEVWAIVPSILLTTLYPLLVASHQRNPNERDNIQMQLVFDLLTTLGFGVALVITLIAPLFIKLLYGENYSHAAHVLMLHAWVAPVTFGASVRAQYMLLEDLNIFHSLAALVGMLIYIPLSLALLKSHGVPGAAIALIVSHWFSGFVFSFFIKRLRPCGIMQLKALFVIFRLRSIRRELLKLA